MPDILSSDEYHYIGQIFDKLATNGQPCDFGDIGDVEKLGDGSMFDFVVMIDEGTHFKFTFVDDKNSDAFLLQAISVGRFTDMSLVLDRTIYPEARLTFYHDSDSPLAWDRHALIEEIITEERMAKMKHHIDQMAIQLATVFTAENSP